MTDFKQKRVLITGAASGIGRLMAEKIGESGGELVLWDINENGMLELSPGIYSWKFQPNQLKKHFR